MNTLLCNFISPEQASQLKPDLPVWFNPLWMNSIGTLFNIAPKILICLKKDNPIAFIPFYEKKFITLKKAYNPTLDYYCPIIFNLPERKLANRDMLLEYEITKEMGEALYKNYQKVLLNLSPDVYDIRGFKDARLTIKPQYTFIKDLKKQEDFFVNEMSTLRKALKSDYVFEKTFNPERHLDLLYQMFTRKQHPFLVNRESLLKVINDLYKAGMIEQYNISKQDVIVSSMLNMLDQGNTVYAWQTATVAEDMKNGASLLLYWNIFNELADKFEFYDLCGANVNGPSRVKAAMGAELKLFFQITKN